MIVVCLEPYGLGMKRGVLRLLDRVDDLDEGEEVEVVIKRKVFTERDYQEVMEFMRRIPKGRIDLLDVVEELYYEEALR